MTSVTLQRYVMVLPFDDRKCNRQSEIGVNSRWDTSVQHNSRAVALAISLLHLAGVLRTSKSKLVWLCVTLLTMCVNTLYAQHQRTDPLHSLLLPPELLIHHHTELGLSDKQTRQIQTYVEDTTPEAQRLQGLADAALGRLAKLLSADRIDEAAALKQLDELQAFERLQKRLHLGIMIKVRNELTAEQRKQAMQLHRRPQDEELARRLQRDLTRIQKEVQARAEAGKPPFEVVGVMQKFPELMQNGQVREAESLLARVLEMLDLKPSSDTPNRPKPGDGTGRVPKIERHKLHSDETIRRQVAGLKKEDVAWRKIEWKTCLLDGLQASHQQNKPIVLWIFIDRPIDDERC